MSAKVQLKIIEGENFTFSEHDTFVFWRMDDCDTCIADDTLLSRHHFIATSSRKISSSPATKRGSPTSG